MEALIGAAVALVGTIVGGFISAWTDHIRAKRDKLARLENNRRKAYEDLSAATTRLSLHDKDAGWGPRERAVLEDYLAALSAVHLNGSIAVRRAATKMHAAVKDIYHRRLTVHEGWPIVARAQEELIGEMRTDLGVERS